MPSALYALLVGIDAYEAPLAPLRGCVNDIEFIDAYLHERSGKNYQPLPLKNAAATRQAVIDGLQQHLTLAQKGDTALFYYSGHGSQQVAHQDFWPIEPDHLDETLVCWDSRQPDHYDLADKTLAILLAQIADCGAHVIVILDCCHSGSGTREGKTERRAPIDHRPRPLESYLCTPAQAATLTMRSASPASQIDWLTLPEGRHILLAACRADETAKECDTEFGRRGVFSYHLGQALFETHGPLTYRELIKRTQALVLSQYPGQSPQLEATQLADLDSRFLDGVLQERPAHFTVHHDPKDGWVLDGGAVHGLPATAGDDALRLALFSWDAPAADLRDSAKALGTAVASKVLPHQSQLTLSGVDETNHQRQYAAVVTYLPLPSLGVRFEGDDSGLQLVRVALAQTGLDVPALYVEESIEGARLRLLAQEGRYRITSPNAERPLVADVIGYTAESAQKVVNYLAHIARWYKTLELHQSGGRLADAIEIKLIHADKRLDGADIELEYRFENGAWQQPEYIITVTNRSETPLYCALLGLWESFAIEPMFAARGIWLKPGEYYQQKFYASVPKVLWEQGITERRDVLMVIASSAEFDPLLLKQSALEAPRERSATRSAPIGALNRLLRRVQTREGSETAETAVGDDWTTAQLTYIVRRPLLTTHIESNKAVNIGAGVTVLPHAQLQAKVRLTSLTQSTRAANQSLLPAIMRDAAPNESQPFYFTTSRGADPGLNVLELGDVVNHMVVTAQQPLQVTLPGALATNEHLLAYAFDGEFYLPVGCARSFNGQTQVDLTRLPAPIPTSATRDIKSTIQILLQKIIGSKLGLGYEYPRLRGATVSPSGVVTYEDDLEKIKTRVAQTERITLYVHGLTGESRGMVASARHYAKNKVLLVFDYESFNTPVEETARDLKKRLTAVGLGPNHGKTLRVIAHSLGGIVVRQLIEREGGQTIVQHLIDLGSPHGGTPISTAQDWATLGVGLAINGLALTAWPIATLNSLLTAFEKLDVTLDQVKPESELLKSLAASDDPHVRYTLIAGHTALTPAALQPDPKPGDKDTRLERFLTRLGYAGANLMLFFGQPNDIAVSVWSAKNVDANRNPKPQTVEVACDHMMFFDSEAGLAAILQAL